MAYDVTEERLKVKGSEQITRDLKVNRDAFINGTTDTKNLTVEDDATVKGEAIFEDDVAIHGDLYVEGTTTTTSEAQVSSSGNYVVTRDNNATPLATGEYSGLAVNNYATGKIATITADKDGTWRISDSATATATTYTNISAYNGVYYTGLSQTTTTGPSGILTNVDADELASVVKNGSSYYHKAGNDWFGPVTLVNNALDIGSIVTDATLITTLNGLTKHDLVYYRSAIDKTIDASTNQPLLTRAESSNLTGGQALTWDATNEKAVGKTIDTTVTASSNNLITSGAVKTAVDNAVDALDVASVGGDGKYISAISEANGKISATATTMDTTPTASSTKAVTSGGVKTAIDNEATARNTAITNAINALDVASAGGDGKYISEISETNGKISATSTTMDTSPTANSTKAVTSGGVKTAIDTAETNAKNLANATGTLAIANGGTGATTAANARTCLGLGSVSTINKNNNTAQYLRGDGTWATPPTSSGTVTVSDKGAADANTPVALCTGTTSIGKSTGSSLTFNTCTGVLSADRFSGRSCGIVELDVNRNMNANWGIFNLWNHKNDNRAWLVSQNKNCLTCTQTVAVDYATSAASATGATKVYKTMATADTNRQILLGEASESAGNGCVYVGNSCKATFNPGTGVLRITSSDDITLSGTMSASLMQATYMQTACIINSCGSCDLCIRSSYGQGSTHLRMSAFSSSSTGFLDLSASGYGTGIITLSASGQYGGSVIMCVGKSLVQAFCLDCSGQLHLKSGKTIIYDL